MDGFNQIWVHLLLILLLRVPLEINYIPFSPKGTIVF